METDAEKEAVTITGREEVGVFWGIQTLLSLLDHDSGRIPNGNIEDCPRFLYKFTLFLESGISFIVSSYFGSMQ